MTDVATLQGRLADLEATKHALMTGKSVASVSHDGKAVTYSRADLAQLNAAILEIRAQLGLTRRRAFGVTF
ncbi:gpW family head-tail joining protein [Roseospira navarrensis]|uniref:Phage tail protein n=1 Tax=Roseospira navarrensis TaxID=140058 RepID=A0A7X1ZGF1_9PROT|nr:gpW family head-tail joining protein [Roseospira navarrensis]MQX37887.1 phage tail protein [Roseospira navarrensis]